MTLCQSIFMALGRKEAAFFSMPRLPLVEIPHHPSGGARPGEHRQDAEIAVGPVRETLTDAGAGERGGAGADAPGNAARPAG